MTSSIFSNTDLLLYGPANVGILDFLRFESLHLQKETSASVPSVLKQEINGEVDVSIDPIELSSTVCIDQNNYSEARTPTNRSPNGQSFVMTTISPPEPETARNDIDFDTMESQFESNSLQKSFQGFMASPISPINTNQSPLTQQTQPEQHDVAPLYTRYVTTEHVELSPLSSPILNTCVATLRTGRHQEALSMSLTRRQSQVESEASTDNALSRDNESPIKYCYDEVVPFVCDDNHTDEKYSQSGFDNIISPADKSCFKHSTPSNFSNTNLSEVFNHQCQISDELCTKTTLLTTRKHMKYGTLPLQVVKSEAHIRHHLQHLKKGSKKQQNICLTGCQSHHQSKDSQSDMSTSAAGFDHKQLDNSLIFGLEDRLDNFNTEMVSNFPC